MSKACENHDNTIPHYQVIHIYKLAIQYNTVYSIVKQRILTERKIKMDKIHLEERERKKPGPGSREKNKKKIVFNSFVSRTTFYDILILICHLL